MRTRRARNVPEATVVGRSALDAAQRGSRPGPPRPSVGLRLRTYLGHWSLDRRIAAGEACDASPEYTLRVRQLTALSARRELAVSIRGVVKYAEREPATSPISAVVIKPTAVRRGRAALLDLADQIELAHRVDPRGVVMARNLLRNGCSPLFNPNAERTVTESVREIQDALVLYPLAAALAT